jgi:hypothetical protein
MTVLGDRVDGVIDVDTHRDTLSAAAVTAVGGLLGQVTVAADAGGYQRLLDFACVFVPGRRCFAVRGCGQLRRRADALAGGRWRGGWWVVEVDRPKRPARRGGKSDAIDAVRAGREALA